MAHDAAARDEADVLGWQGITLRVVKLFNTTADMVVQIDRDVLRRRYDVLPGPETDGLKLELWETQPGISAPPSPLSLVGVIFNERALEVGPSLPRAFQWRGFAQTAVRVNRKDPGPKVLGAAKRFRVGIVSPVGPGAGWKQVLEPGPRTGDRSVTDRLIEEQIYAWMLRRDLVEQLLKP